jgi:hypothetical protein
LTKKGEDLIRKMVSFFPLGHLGRKLLVYDLADGIYEGFVFSVVEPGSH